MANYDKIRHANGDIPTAALRLEMQRAMQAHAAVFRTGDVLKEGVDKMMNLYKKLDHLKVTDRGKCWNTDVVSDLAFCVSSGENFVMTYSSETFLSFFLVPCQSWSSRTV